MKAKFSKHWISSSQVRKQRKYRANAPLHILRKLLSSSLSKELRTKYGTRNTNIRKGDEVLIMRGRFKGKTGKIASVDLKKQRVSIEGIQNKKKDGTKINVYFNTSNLQIKTLSGDKKRLKRTGKKVEVKTEEKKPEVKETPKKEEPKKTEKKEIKNVQ